MAESDNAEQVESQARRVELESEFGEAIGHDLWQFEGGLNMLKNPTPEQRVKLLSVSEKSLAGHINDAFESGDSAQRERGIQALIRISILNGGVNK
jgi:hypothetical protein